MFVKPFPPVFTETLTVSLTAGDNNQKYMYTEWGSSTYDSYEEDIGYISLLEYKIGVRFILIINPTYKLFHL